jgi:NNP family nitrate/nitrite transporter-like MFS transporter
MLKTKDGGLKDKLVGTALCGLFLLTGLFFFNFTARVIFSPLLPTLEDEFGFDHAAAGSFFLLISSGYFLSILDF